MTPLLSLLLVGPKAGLWRIDRFGGQQQDLLETFGRSSLIVDQLNMADKSDVMGQLASELQLPEWFGRNWDALNDSLIDRAGSSDWPDLVVLRPLLDATEAAQQNLKTLTEILSDVAETSARWFLIAGPEPASIPSLPTFAG